MNYFKAIFEEKSLTLRKGVYFIHFLRLLYFSSVNEATVLAALFFFLGSLCIVFCVDRLTLLCNKP